LLASKQGRVVVKQSQKDGHFESFEWFQNLQNKMKNIKMHDRIGSGIGSTTNAKKHRPLEEPKLKSRRRRRGDDAG
jgi:hypothetical protein